jgi:predicted DNA-binding protein
MPQPLKHRGVGNSCEVRIRVSESTHERLKNLAQANGSTVDVIVWGLLDFYELKSLDLLIENLNKIYLRGLTLVEKSQLIILYALLEEIDNKIGLNAKDLLGKN